MARGLCTIFSSKRSFLLRKRMMDVSVNHLLLQMLSNSFMLSCIRFWQGRQQPEPGRDHQAVPTQLLPNLPPPATAPACPGRGC